MNNRSRQVLQAMRMMYGKKGFRPKTPEDIRTALNDGQQEEESVEV